MASQSSFGIRWRSKPSFVIVTVAFGLFTDLVLYGIVVPILPFVLRERFQIPDHDLQAYTSGQLAVYSGSSVLFSLPAGWIASKIGSRQLFLVGLVFLCLSSLLFAYAPNFALLTASRVFQGMSAAVVWTAGMDMVQDAVPRDEIGEAIGTVRHTSNFDPCIIQKLTVQIFASISAGELVAPVIGGIVYEWAGIHGIFGVSAALLLIDFVLRLLVVDPKAVAKYACFSPVAEDGRETDPLLPDPEEISEWHDSRYEIDDGEGRAIFKTLPILYCFRQPRLHMAMLLAFTQSLIMGAMDATVPMEARELFGFSSMQTGLIFIALMTPYLALGRYFGQLVDRHGARLVTIAGYGYLIPCFILLGLPERRLLEQKYNIALYCCALALCGIGLAAVSSLSFVEAIDVIGKYEAANPGLFGENGPYAQLFGFNSVYIFAGLGVGPIVAGALRDRFGYQMMGAAFAIIAAVTAVVAFFVVGPPQKSKDVVSDEVRSET